MKSLFRVFALVLLALGLAGAGVAQDFTKYHNYAEMSAIAQGLAKAAPGMVKVTSIGKTLEKRDIWALEIANPAGVPVGERPGLLIAANFEGDHLIGSELALFVADYLVKNAAKPEVKARLDQSVIYIIPRMNPDGAEFMWAPLKWARRTNATPFDDDNDGRTDEDGPDDLNGDGLITVIRVADPNGAYMIDPEEKRLLKRADPKKSEKGEYSLHLEGIDNDNDGFINEDPAGGVNLNRNFMHEYANYKPEVGRYMVSESETKALLEWMVKHRNIAAIMTFGESDNLIVAPNASGRLSAARQLDLAVNAEASVAGAGRTGIFAAGGGIRMFGGRGGGGGEMMISPDMLQALMASGGAQFIMGGGGGGGGGQSAAAQQPTGRAAQPARAAAVTFNAADLDYFRSVSAKYAELTGIRQAPLLVKPEGAFFQVGYFQFGVPSFSTPGWGIPETARVPGQGMMPQGSGAGGTTPPAGAQMQMMQMPAGAGRQGGGAAGRSGLPTAGAEMGGGDQAQGVDRQILQWMDKEKVEGFVAWTKVKHPEFGEVEVGGFKPYAAVNPPAAKIAEMGKSHAEFALYLGTLYPKMQVAKLEAIHHGGGIFRIKAEVSNIGYWPTAFAHAVVAGAVKPTMVQLQVAPETILSGSQKTSFIQALTGSDERVKYEWLIKAKAGDTVNLKVVAQKGGADSRSVVLK
jgi:hypothetical protein